MTRTEPRSRVATRSIVVVFVGLMLANALSSLDGTIVATALPTIVGDLPSERRDVRGGGGMDGDRGDDPRGRDGRSASLLVRAITEPDPMCMQITVWVSSHAASSGSQWRSASWIDGRPRFAGSSVNVMACCPRAALRRTSAAARCGSHSGTMPRGMRRPRLSPHHSSIIQSL